jgi:hypothetical protein
MVGTMPDKVKKVLRKKACPTLHKTAGYFAMNPSRQQLGQKHVMEVSPPLAVCKIAI